MNYYGAGLSRASSEEAIDNAIQNQIVTTFKIPGQITMAMFAFVMGCKPDVKSESTVHDSTVMSENALNVPENPDDSLSTIPRTSLSEEEAAKYFINLDQFLFSSPLDTSEFQVVTTTCAILVEKTQASIREMKEAKEQEEAERQEARKKMSAAELAHDDSVREDEESIVGDDGMYYNSLKQQGLETIGNLKIKLITAQDKGYLKLIDVNKKERVLDIRGSMEQGWTVIFFNIQKEPKVMDLTNVNRDAVVQYFFYE